MSERRGIPRPPVPQRYVSSTSCAAQRQDKQWVFPGRAAPSQPLPVGRACCPHGQGRGSTSSPQVGKPGFPYFHLSIHAAAPHNAGMNILLFLGGLRPPKPSPLAGCFLGGGRGAAPPRPYAQTLPQAGYVHISSSAISMARNRAAALLQLSWYSASGSLSATTPPPACM